MVGGWSGGWLVGWLVVGLKKPSRSGFNNDLKILGVLILRHSHLGRLFPLMQVIMYTDAYCIFFKYILYI